MGIKSYRIFATKTLRKGPMRAPEFSLWRRLGRWSLFFHFACICFRTWIINHKSVRNITVPTCPGRSWQIEVVHFRSDIETSYQTWSRYSLMANRGKRPPRQNVQPSSQPFPSVCFGHFHRIIHFTCHSDTSSRAKATPVRLMLVPDPWTRCALRGSLSSMKIHFSGVSRVQTWKYIPKWWRHWPPYRTKWSQ